MAAATSEGIEGTPALQKKKTRLNPARRRAVQEKSKSLHSQINTKVADTTVQPGNAKARAEATKATGLKPDCQELVFQQSGNQPTGIKATCLRAGGNLAASRPATTISHPNKSGGVQDHGNSKTLVSAAPAFVSGGLLGCAAGAVVMLGTSLWKNSSGAESAALVARTAQVTLNNLMDEMIVSLKAGTCNTPESLDMLRRTSLAYASMVPGGVSTVERIFCEINIVRKRHGKELDRIVAEAHKEISQAGLSGASPARLQTAVLRNLVKLSTFTTNATKDIATRDPNLNPSSGLADRTASCTAVPTLKLNMSVRHKPAVAV